MHDLIDRQAAIDAVRTFYADNYALEDSIEELLEKLPSAQPEIKCVANVTLTDEQIKEAFEKAKCEILAAQSEDWIERNKERILQAGMEGREIEFRIGGRLFAIREKAQ